MVFLVYLLSSLQKLLREFGEIERGRVSVSVNSKEENSEDFCWISSKNSACGWEFNQIHFFKVTLSVLAYWGTLSLYCIFSVSNFSSQTLTMNT